MVNLLTTLLDFPLSSTVVSFLTLTASIYPAPWRPLPIFPSIKSSIILFSIQSFLRITWPKYESSVLPIPVMLLVGSVMQFVIIQLHWPLVRSMKFNKRIFSTIFRKHVFLSRFINIIFILCINVNVTESESRHRLNRELSYDAVLAISTSMPPCLA